MGNNDLIAIGALDTVLRRGISVPDEISVTGFDNIRFSGLVRVPLTTVEQPKYEMGIAAFDLLLNAINDGESPNAFRLFDTQLIIRQSTGACREVKAKGRARTEGS